MPYDGGRFVAVLAGLGGTALVLTGAGMLATGSPSAGALLLTAGTAPLAWLLHRSHGAAAGDGEEGTGGLPGRLAGAWTARALAIAVGVTTVAAGWAVVLLHPPLVGDAVAALDGLSRETVLTTAAVAILLLHGLVLARARIRSGGDREDGGGAGGGDGTPGVAADGPAVAVSDDVLGALDDGDHEEAAEGAAEELREAAVDAVARARGVDRGAAAAIVDAGEWTADHRATAFVGRDVRWDRWTVLRDWLAPEHRVERWIERTARAVAALDTVARGRHEAPNAEADGDDGGGGRSDAATVEIPAGAGERRPSWPLKVAAVVLAAAGMLMSQPLVLLATIVPLAFLAVGGVAEVPPTSVRIERRVGDGSPGFGERVPVALTATNTGDRTVTDLRVADRPPEGATVVEGDATLRAALRPGESTTVRYRAVLDAESGTFDGVDVTVGNLGGRWTARRDAAVETSVEPRTEVHDLPLRRGSATIHGRRPTDAPGHGNEFYGVREYRSEDPLHRIDWNRFAKTGELQAIQYRARSATRTVLVVDLTADLPVDEATDDTTGDMVRAGTFAALRWAARVGDDVAVLLLGRGRSGWLAPRSGEEQRTRLEEAFRTFEHTVGTPMEGLVSRGVIDGVLADAAAAVDRVRPTARVVAVTAGVGGSVPGLVRRFAAEGNPVAAILAAGDRDGALGEAAAVRRWRTADRAARRGAGVVVWRYGEPLALATARATEVQEP